MSATSVERVRSKADLKAFVDLPFRLYRDDPLWVPPLKASFKKTFDARTNPFFEHGEIRPFLARRGGRVVGRIAAIVDQFHLERHGETTGFFGFLEAEDDPEIFAALFEGAREDLRSRGMTQMWGPMNPSINHECGLLIEGFDHPPGPLMPHNPPYYEAHCVAQGLEKLNDLFAYIVPPGQVGKHQETVQRIERLGKVLKRRVPDLSIRPMDMANFEEEAFALNDLFNTVRDVNWGFVPVTKAEFKHTAKDMKKIIDPRLVPIIRVGDKIVGCLLSIPDFNPILRKCRGSLFPTGWYHFLRMRRKLTGARIFGAAALPKYRSMGVTALLWDYQIRAARDAGYGDVEIGWVAEDNLRSLQSVEKALDIKPVRTYRVYVGPA